MIDERFFKADDHVLGSKGLVYVGEKIIVYRRDSNTAKHPLEIDVPGGGSNTGETPFETFTREVKEEFNVRVCPQDITYAKRYKSAEDLEKYGFFAVAKLPDEVGKSIVLGDEGLEWMLIGVEEYLELGDAWPVYQARTKDYLDRTK